MNLIKRNKNVKINYYNENGLIVTESFNELFTRLFLHEQDHLDGKSFHSIALKKIEIRKLQDKHFLDTWNNEQVIKNLMI